MGADGEAAAGSGSPAPPVSALGDTSAPAAAGQPAAESAGSGGAPDGAVLPLLSLVHAAKAFGAVHAVVDGSIGLYADEAHALVGENGAGKSTLLCQLTADACGRPVIAGPAEAAALGNVLVQARSLGAVPADLDGMRALLRGTQDLRRYEPSADGARGWAAAAGRVSGSGSTADAG